VSVTADDIVQGAVKWLSSFDDVVAVLSTYGDGTPYLFQRKLWIDMEGSQGTAAVIRCVGGWAGANTYNTMRFPRLCLELWADPIRDAGGNISEPGEVYRRLSDAFQVIDARLHRPQAGEQMWGTIRTVACSRLTEPDEPFPIPDGDGLLRTITFYAVTQG